LHDVAVIGGGPGGSTAAHLLAAAGRDVVLLEREPGPRFHIGESLLPHNMRLFEKLGVVAELRARFIEKWGVEFVASGSDRTRLLHFEDAIDPRYPMCFQVLRSELDQLLLDAAAARGARVRQGATVQAARRDADGAWRLTVQEGDATGSATREVAARFLIDASGRDGVLARQQGSRQMDPRHRRAAVFAHYRGVPRREGRDAGNIVMILMTDGWFWFIPFKNGVTSVGVVATGSRIREQGLRPEAVLDRAIERCPAARLMMAHAERLTPVHTTSDWTYSSPRIAGEGYLMVGDAGAFVDPVFSSGVLLAMSSGEMAADLLEEGLRANDLSPRRFRSYAPKVLRHVRAYARMVETFYGAAFPQLCFDPENRIGIASAVLNLLAGEMEPAWAVRWRLELFYLIAATYRRFGVGPPVALHRVFDATPATGAAGALSPVEQGR
jgi:flavin-dependent dehydrogenase